MIKEIQKLMDEYQNWLKGKTSLREIDGWVEITTPYIDRHNDYLQIFVKKQNGGYLLTDDGYIISDLSLSGCDLNTEKRQRLLQQTLRGFGVEQSKDTLMVVSNESNFSFKKHSLLQSMLAVNDLFYMAESYITSLFYEDVVSWLEKQEIRYTPRVKFAGRSGYDHHFDFVISKSKTHPERLIKVINKPTRDNAGSLMFSWLDTKDDRPPMSKAYACLNDTEGRISKGVLVAFKNYDIRPIEWSKKDDFIEELAA
ncbi:DUF1829 domain-containing protein [bacterium]|nr:DUF1829 domain-containing protein [bacterium]